VSSNAVARLVVGSLAAVGAVTLALHLSDEPAASVGEMSAASVGATAWTPYDAAPSSTFALSPAGTRTVLESTLTRPQPAPVDLDELAEVLPGTGRLGPVHVDPVPPGVSLDDPTDTASLYARAGLAEPEQEYAAGEVPPGTPKIPTLSQHVAPSCSGTGTDGKRVLALYVRETSTPSRYTSVLPLLRNEIANVDDAFALSAQQSGGVRRVRWVHQDCVPVVQEVVVPDGSLNSSFPDTIAALQSRGYTDKNRKYLAFTEANDLCGVGSMYPDTRVTGNYNDGYAASYSRVDTSCWSVKSHSVPAHELTHNLGSVFESAPHGTTYGHCSDEADLMCYDDGSGIPMRSVCAAAQQHLLDCNGDDYFNTAPPAGSFLTSNWNTASSSFLDRSVPAADPDPLTVTATPSRTSAETGDLFTVDAASTGATGYRWTAAPACALTGSTSQRVSVRCPSAVTGPVAITVTATDAAGRAASAAATVTLTRAAAPTATITAPAEVGSGAAFSPSAQVTGKAPFSYAWTAWSPCLVSQSTTAQPQAACIGTAGQSGTIALTVTQADGQQVQAAPAVVSLSGDGPVPGTPPVAGWSAPTATKGDPTVVSAVLVDVASGSPLPGALVELQVRRDQGQPWQPTASTGLHTGADGRAAVDVRRIAAAWYRFVHVGGSGVATSGEILVKGRTKAKADWKGARKVVTGRLLRADGTPLAGRTVTLERRYAGSTRWVRVTGATTSAEGRLAVKQRPKRTAYFRWVYAGSKELLPARSAAVRAGG
jgi:hypothetical protein